MSCGTRVLCSARAILMAVNSSVSSLWMNYLPDRDLRTADTANCCYCELLVASKSTTLRQPAPSPVLHLLWLGTPLPNLSARAPAADAFAEELLRTALLIPLGTANCSAGVLRRSSRGGPSSLRATRSGRQSRRRPTTSLASELHHRTVLRTAPTCHACLAVHLCRAVSISATRETIATAPPNVYLRRHRFPSAVQRDSSPWAPRASAGADARCRGTGGRWPAGSQAAADHVKHFPAVTASIRV